MINWLGTLLSNDNKASVKRLCFLIAVLTSVGWLTTDMIIHKGITDPWNSAFYAFLAAATGGYVGGVALGEKKKKQETDGE